MSSTRPRWSSHATSLGRKLSGHKAGLLAVLLASALGGCAGTVAYVVPPRPDNVATLRFVKPAQPEAHPFAEGIYRVDGSAYFRRPHPIEVFLAPGRHEIGVNCTQFVYTDEAPSIEFKFAAGARYALTCEAGRPVIRENYDGDLKQGG